MFKILLVFITMSTVAYAGQPSNIIGNCQSCNLPKPSENWSQRQKQERGMIPTKKYTTCRLYKTLKSRTTGRQACIYIGGNFKIFF